MKSKGRKMDPLGTLQITFNNSEWTPLKETNCFLLNEKLLTNLRQFLLYHNGKARRVSLEAGRCHLTFWQFGQWY